MAIPPIAALEIGTSRTVVCVGEPDENGWQPLAEFIVVNGTIVSANFDAMYSKEYVADGENANAKYFVVDGDKATAQSKDQLKEAYGMAAAGSKLEWYQQAQVLEEYVVANQTIYPVTAEGLADGIAGVSIHASAYYDLFNQAFGK